MNRGRPSRGGRGGGLPKIQAKVQSRKPPAPPAPKRLAAIPAPTTTHNLTKTPKPAPKTPVVPKVVSPRRPFQLNHAARKPKLAPLATTTPAPAQGIQAATTALLSSMQKAPLYDRLVSILSKEKANDPETVDAELKMISMYDDPAEMVQMTQRQLDELARLALEAETFQATLLAATVIEQMAEDQHRNTQPLLNDAFLRFLLNKLREQRNWQRLLGVEGEYLLTATDEADTILHAYAVIMENAYAAWTVRARSNPAQGVDDQVHDQDLYDSWIEFWSMLFHVIDRYAATLASRVGQEAFSTKGLSEDARLRFLDDLLHFVNQLRDPNEIELRTRAVQCFEIYSSKLDTPVTTCVRADYETEGGGGATSSAHFDEILTALTSKCLQCGPKLLGRPEDGALDAASNVTVENVNWRTEGLILRGLFNAFETVKDYQQHPMDPVVRPNVGDMFEKVLFQVNHTCVGETVCKCYSRCADPALIDACEIFICDIVADRFATDFAPHIDAFVAHYRGVPNDRWMKALLIVYPSAKREVTKYFTMFAEMENDSQRHEFFHDWRPIALSLMIKVSHDNAKLFDSKLIKSTEAIFFSKKPVLSGRALLVLRNVAANHPRAMLGCGKHYYSAAAELPGLELAPMNLVNEILRNVGLQSEEEAERVVTMMETQVRHSQDKPFIEDVLRQWHYIAIVYHEPIEARRSLIDEYRQDPMLCKAAYEVFALATGQQTKATACVLM